MADEAPVVGRFVDEARDVDREIRRLVGEQVRFLSLGLTVFTAAAVLLADKLARGDDWSLVVRLLLPVAVGTVVQYGLLLSGEIAALAGYKRHLEEVVNEAYEADVMQWESRVAPAVTVAPTARRLFFGAVGLGLLVLLGDAVSVVRLWGDASRLVRTTSYLAVTGWAYTAVGLVAAARYAAGANEAAYRVAAAGRRPRPPSRRRPAASS